MSREKLIDALPLKNPWALAVDPSSFCNFHCQFCPTHNKSFLKKKRNNSLMSLSLFKKIVDDVQEIGEPLRSLKLWKDGEPLLNKDLPRFIQYAQEKKIAQQIRLTTNGSLLDKMAQDIIDAGLDWIMISYLSPKESIYEEHAGQKDMRDRVIKNVELLRSLRDKNGTGKPFISVKMCQFPFVSPEDVEIFKKLFNPLADEVVIHKDPMNWDNSHNTDLLLGASNQHLKSKKACPYAWYQMNINSNGLVSICPVDWNFKTIIGDVDRESIYKFWTGEKMRRFRQMFVHQDFTAYPVCQNCNYYYHHEDNIDDFVLSQSRKEDT